MLPTISKQLDKKLRHMLFINNPCLALMVYKMFSQHYHIFRRLLKDRYQLCYLRSHYTNWTECHQFCGGVVCIA
jgi:hypothetical protein